MTQPVSTLPLTTARLVIRRYQTGDSLPPAAQPVDCPVWPAGFDPAAEAPDFAAYYAWYPLPGGGFFAVTRVSDGAVLGRIGLIPRGDLFDPAEVELSYALEPAHRGQGYITEAGRALAKYALESLHLPRIFAGTAQDNVASQRAAERMGLTREADRTFYRMPHRMFWLRRRAAGVQPPERIRPEVGG